MKFNHGDYARIGGRVGVYNEPTGLVHFFDLPTVPGDHPELVPATVHEFLACECDVAARNKGNGKDGGR